MIKLTLRIPDGEKPERANKAIARRFPEIPPRRLRDAFQNKDIKRNGQRIAPETILMPGDELLLYVDMPALLGPEIIFQDEAYVIVNKRQGVPTQGEGSVEAACVRHLGAAVFACHRLDTQTGGLLLLAKSEAALAVAEQAFKDHALTKTYRALVKGCPDPREAVLRGFLRKDVKSATVQIFDAPVSNALPIETRYRVIDADAHISRVEIGLITGRTHQIRAHMAHVGHPVLGDDKYGDWALNREQGIRRQKLWATGLVLWDGRAFSVEEGF